MTATLVLRIKALTAGLRQKILLAQHVDGL